MLDKENRAPSRDSHAGPASGKSSGPAARLKIPALALVVAAMTIFGSAPRTVAKPAPADDGVQTYKSNCVICHGENGAGTVTGKSLNAPDLRSDAVQKLTLAQMIEQVSDGKNNMPPFKNTLSPDEVKAVVAYVRATFGKGK